MLLCDGNHEIGTLQQQKQLTVKNIQGVQTPWCRPVLRPCYPDQFSIVSATLKNVVGMYWVSTFSFICTLVGNLNWEPLATLQDFSAYRGHQILVRSFLVLRAQCNREFVGTSTLSKEVYTSARSCQEEHVLFFFLILKAFLKKQGSCNHPKQIYLYILFGINNAIPQKPLGCN